MAEILTGHSPQNDAGIIHEEDAGRASSNQVRTILVASTELGKGFCGDLNQKNDKNGKFLLKMPFFLIIILQ
jgi:hypothetical protein